MDDKIQAMLFDKNYWTTNDARTYLKKSNKKPIKRVHITDNYYRYRLIEPNYNKYNYIFKKWNNNIDYIIQIPIRDKNVSQPRDLLLYNKIKEQISNKYKHSAYRSGLIVKTYKDEYYKKYKRDDAYIGDKPKMSNLQRWFLENWTNERGETAHLVLISPVVRIETYIQIVLNSV